MSHSPWGKIDHVTPVCSGACFVSTPSHGGLRITRKLLSEKSLSEKWLLEKCATSFNDQYVFFEEDCAYLVCLFDCPELLRIYAQKFNADENEVFEKAKKMTERFYPTYFNYDGE